MFHERNTGKIIIHLENDNGKINSHMNSRGIARKAEVALTTLLINFVSLSQEKGKDPKELINNHLDEILLMLNDKKKNSIP